MMHCTPTGELPELQANAKQLHLEMGLPRLLMDAPLKLAAPYLTDSWLKDLILYLHTYNISLDDPLPKLSKKRTTIYF
jgi:hypothetical protein